MTPCAKFPLIAGLLLSSVQFPFAAATGFNAGNSFVVMQRGQAATRSGAFTGNFYQPGGAGGGVVSNTNLFTGQPSYTVPLYTLDARGEVAFPFILTFSGPTFPTVENNNDKAPAGWLGVGWSMRVPFVAVNHKGTPSYADDVILCDLGSYGGGQILWQPETLRYYLATAPGVVITRDTVDNPASPLFRQIKSWTFTFPGGVRMVFGNAGVDTVHDSERQIRHFRGMILASPYNADSAKPFLYRWDLRRVEDDSRRTCIDFEHEKFEEPLWAGKGYTRESYLKRAVWRDAHGNEIRRVELETQPLDTGEFSGYFPGEAKTSQKLFETRRLHSLTVFHEGAQDLKILLRRKVKNLAYGKKGVLDSVIPLHGPREIRAPGWSFSYRDGDQLLEEIVPPSGAKERYAYQSLNLAATLGGQEGIQAFRDTNGALVVPSNNGDGWSVEARCDDRFCTEIVRNDLPAIDEVYVRVAHNTGNYFDTENIVLQRKLKKDGTSVNEWKIIPRGDYFLIGNSDAATLELWEWDGAKFRLRNQSVGEAGDPIRTHFGYGGGLYADIEITAGGSYFLVYRKQASGSLSRRIWVYLKDPVTGKWNNLTAGKRGTAACKFDNPPKRNDGGWYDPRANTDTCFSWKTPALITASDRMFAVRSETEDILYWYALNASGNGFDSIGQLIPFLPDTVQEKSGGIESPQNWNYDIHEMRMGADYLLIKSANQAGDRSRYDFLFYDGKGIRRIGKLGFEKDRLDHAFNASAGTGHDRNVWLADNYFIHANTKSDAFQRVEYWRRRQAGDSVYFEMAKLLRTDVEDEQDFDLRVATGSRFFSLEYYPASTFAKGLDPHDYPKTDGSGNIKSWLYRINHGGGADSVPASAYTLAWNGCSRKAWNMSFSGMDNVLMATVHRGSGACGCTSNCHVKNLSFKTNLEASAFSMDSILDPINSASHQVKMRDRSWSLGDRLGMAMFIKHAGSPDSLLIRRYFFNGRSYSEGVTTDVVRSFTRHATPDSLYPPQVTEFDFGAEDPGFVTEFNHNGLTAQFEYARVSQRGLPGGFEHNHHVDNAGYKLLLDSASLAGRTRSVHTVNGHGDTITRQATAYNPSYSRGWSSPGVRNGAVPDPWPQGVAVNRVVAEQVREHAENRSHRISTTSYHAHDDNTERPLFTTVDHGDRVSISQIILDSSGRRLRQKLAFDYPASAKPSDSAFESARTTPLPANGGTGKYAIGWTEIGYDEDFRFKPNHSLAWRDPGGDWNDEELKAGPIPDYQPGRYTFIPAEVTRRDSLGQVLEVRSETYPGTHRHTTVFYEGRAALPVGIVTNARRDNTAILTAENGSVPQLLAQGKLDRDGAWSGDGVTYSSTRAHTGRYSFKVTDGFGPSGNLHLKDVTTGGFGFVASAWIYGDMEDQPIFAVSRRHANGSQRNEVRASPVDGPYQRGKWQRWEATLSYAALTADGMFADEAGDYLRFFVGSIDVNPAFDPARVVYVDDIVLRPDNAIFSLSAYDAGGRVTHATDTHHRVLTHEYGFAGQPAGVRDENGRVFGQQGNNRPGENQP